MTPPPAGARSDGDPPGPSATHVASWALAPTTRSVSARLPGFRVAAASFDLGQSLPPSGTERGHDRLQRLLAACLPSREALLEGGILDWPGRLRDYQREGVAALIEKPALLLADDMGLGKTIQVAAAARLLIHRRLVESLLLIVPASLIGNWLRELHAWAPELRVTIVAGAAAERAWRWKAPAHVYLVSYETFRGDFLSRLVPDVNRTWDLVVLDEAQRIKNADAETSQACRTVRRRRAWALTGTPLENRLDDLESILGFTEPAEDGAPRRFTGPTDLLRHQHEVQLRRRKPEVLTQLPPKTTVDLALRLSGSQLAAYKLAQEEGLYQIRALGEAVRIHHVLELLLRLKQICNFCPTTGMSAKLTDLRERLTQLRASSHRALVFSQFTDDRFGVRAIARSLAEFSPLVYAGDLSMPEREAVIRRFKQDRRHTVLIISLRAGGQGLNLQDASYVFHFDRWWNPAVERQAEDRAHRMGQRLPVTVYRYVCEETIEARIVEILGQKQGLFDAVIDDVSLEKSRGLDARALFDLAGVPLPGFYR